MNNIEEYSRKILSDGGLNGRIQQEQDFAVSEKEKQMILDLAHQAYEELEKNGSLSKETASNLIATIDVLTMPFSYVAQDSGNQELINLGELLGEVCYLVKNKN